MSIKRDELAQQQRDDLRFDERDRERERGREIVAAAGRDRSNEREQQHSREGEIAT